MKIAEIRTSYKITMENEMCLNNYQYLTKNDVVKFVVSNLSDLNKAKEIIENAEKDAQAKGKEIELKAKEHAYSIKEEAEKEIKKC